MPDIQTSPHPHAVDGYSFDPASAPGARRSYGLPARLLGLWVKVREAVRKRVREIVTGEFRYEESAVPYVQCEHCGDIHPMNVRCGARATGFCVDEGRRRLLNGRKCSKCGSRSITDIHFRWAVEATTR